MSFDLLTLKYLTEVDKTGSISRAAHNLFISQPHLSNIIRNTEQELGAALFRRSVKGVEATDEGRLFLRRARDILEQADSLESLFRMPPQDSLKINFSATRSYQVMRKVAEFVREHEDKKRMNLRFKGTNPFTVVEDVCNREADFGMLHYYDTQREYFQAAYKSHHLNSRVFYDREFLVAMSVDNPLTKEKQLTREMLEEQTVVLYGDYEAPPASYDVIVEMTDIVMSTRRIYVYDRGDAMGMLSECPNSYMWITGLHPALLSRYRLVMRRCEGVTVHNRGDIIWLADRKLSPLHQELIEKLLSIDWTEVLE